MTDETSVYKEWLIFIYFCNSETAGGQELGLVIKMLLKFMT